MTCGQIPERMRTKSALLDWREDVVRLKRVRESAWSASGLSGTTAPRTVPSQARKSTTVAANSSSDA
jgi:hypothetical protein